MMSLTIEEVNRNNRKGYEQYILSREDTTFVDCWEWREVVEKVYRLPHFWYIAKENGKVTGTLSLTLSKHPIFGRYLVTAPFANQGGFYADSESAFQSLLNKTTELQYQLRARYTLIRHLNGNLNPPDSWQQDPSYATYHLPLNTDPEVFLRKHLRSKERNQISKSMTHGLKVKFGRMELLDDFWYVISHSMKELGSPYHPKCYLETLMDILKLKTEIAILYTKDYKPVGGSLLIYHNKTVVQLFATFLKRFRYLTAGDYLYWSVIDECSRRGIKWLDMGRSLVGSGNEHFKMKWRPIRHELAYWYKLSPGSRLPNLNQDNPKFRLIIKTWQRMPLSLIRLVGPKLISGIL